MRTLSQHSTEVDSANARCAVLLKEILAACPAAEKSALVRSNTSLWDPQSHTLVVLDEGNLSYQQAGRVLFLYEPGDAIGFQSLFAGSKEISITSDFAVRVTRYDLEALHKVLVAAPVLFTKWNQYLAGQQYLLSLFYSLAAKSEGVVEPHITSFEAGEVIVEQGSLGSDVFSLVQGHADVFVDNVKVGEVLPDEMFGILGAVTGTPRNATVKASELSLVVKMERENFVDLMQTRPGTAVKMVEDMARAIVSLNARVLALTQKKDDSVF